MTLAGEAWPIAYIQVLPIRRLENEPKSRSFRGFLAFSAVFFDVFGFPKCSQPVKHGPFAGADAMRSLKVTPSRRLEANERRRSRLTPASCEKGGVSWPNQLEIGSKSTPNRLEIDRNSCCRGVSLAAFRLVTEDVRRGLWREPGGGLLS